MRSRRRRRWGWCIKSTWSRRAEDTTREWFSIPIYHLNSWDLGNHLLPYNTSLYTPESQHSDAADPLFATHSFTSFSRPLLHRFSPIRNFTHLLPSSSNFYTFSRKMLPESFFSKRSLNSSWQSDHQIHFPLTLFSTLRYLWWYSVFLKIL